MKSKDSVEDNCPCGRNATYPQCCGRYHEGLPAPSAEALMRSRYAAYVLVLEPYLLATWHTSTRPVTLDLEGDGKIRWLGLEIKRHQASGTDSAIVEFAARYRRAGRAQRLHEISRFVREDGRWYYVDGEFPEKRNG